MIYTLILRGVDNPGTHYKRGDVVQVLPYRPDPELGAYGNKVVPPKFYFIEVETDDPEFDLEVLAVQNIVDLPVTRISMVVFAIVGGNLHLRVFNAAGNMVIDKTEAQMTGSLKDFKRFFLNNQAPDISDWHIWKKREWIGKLANATGLPYLVQTKRLQRVLEKIEYNTPDGEFADTDPPPAITRKRAWRVLVDNMPLAARQKFQANGKMRIGSSGEADYTWGQVKAFVRRLRDDKEAGDFATGEIDA